MSMNTVTRKKSLDKLKVLRAENERAVNSYSQRTVLNELINLVEALYQDGEQVVVVAPAPAPVAGEQA